MFNSPIRKETSFDVQSLILNHYSDLYIYAAQQHEWLVESVGLPGLFEAKALKGHSWGTAIVRTFPGYEYSGLPNAERSCTQFTEYIIELSQVITIDN